MWYLAGCGSLGILNPAVVYVSGWSNMNSRVLARLLQSSGLDVFDSVICVSSVLGSKRPVYLSWSFIHTAFSKNISSMCLLLIIRARDGWISLISSSRCPLAHLEHAFVNLTCSGTISFRWLRPVCLLSAWDGRATRSGIFCFDLTSTVRARCSVASSFKKGKLVAELRTWGFETLNGVVSMITPMSGFIAPGLKTLAFSVSGL